MQAAAEEALEAAAASGLQCLTAEGLAAGSPGSGPRALPWGPFLFSACLAALLPAIESYGDLGVINDLNQNTYNQGIAAAAALLGQYTAVPPAALPGSSYAGPPHIAAPNVRTLVYAGDAFDVEVWVVDAEPPASVQLCSSAAESSSSSSQRAGFACEPLPRVGSAGQVYRGALSPPAGHFDAYVQVTTKSGSTLLLPPGAPAEPWRVAVA
jgi:hypothetical protein